MSVWQRIWLLFHDSRPPHVIDAERHPENYFTCSCGDGPWHKTWASPQAWERAEIRRAQGKPMRLLGACCSGAD